MSAAAAEVLAAYKGSDADRTRALYAKLTALGPAGEIAVNLLRATKTSERAKAYRRRSSRGAAYDTKGWAMGNLAALLAAHAGGLGVAWGWGADDATPGFPWVFYVEIPDHGQVSFHARDRGEGPDFARPWDGVRGVSGQRACAWAARLLDGHGTAVAARDTDPAVAAGGHTTVDLPRDAGPSAGNAPRRPLAIDLFCGLGGWTEGLLAEGYYVVGFDIERHQYGEYRYPAQLVVQDVTMLHGSQFKDAALIVASPPCQEFSWMAMPWSRAKQVARALRGEDEFPTNYRGSRTIEQLTALFNACFRIQREACEAAGHHIPMVVENVKGAQPWVGRARWSFGSFYLWGDVPALMPIALRRGKSTGMNWSDRTKRGQDFTRIAGNQAIKNNGGSWFNIAHNTTSGKAQNPDGRKTNGAPHLRNGEPHTRYLTNPNEHTGTKHQGSGAIWFDTGPANLSSKSPRGKMASAMIAKIPLLLSRHIAATFRSERGVRR